MTQLLKLAQRDTSGAKKVLGVIEWLIARSEVGIRRGREERKEGHRSTKGFDRESGETTALISSIAISGQSNQRGTVFVGTKCVVGARERSAPPEGGGAEIDHRTPPKSVTSTQRRD